MLDRARASRLGSGNGTQLDVGLGVLFATDPVPSGYHWLVTAVSVWRRMAAADNYDTLTSGIFMFPPSIQVPAAPVLFATIPFQAIHVPKNMDFFFEGVPRTNFGGVFLTRMDSNCTPFVLPSLWRLVAALCVTAGPSAGTGLMTFQYTSEKNC